MSQKTVGGISNSLCIAYFLNKGFRVSMPLFDDAPYDLIVDNFDSLLKIQCKTSRGSDKYKAGKSKYPRVSFMPRNYHKPFSVSSFDFLWVMTKQYCYLIPSSDIPHTESGELTSIVISPKYSTFIVDVDFLSGQDPLRVNNFKPLSDSEKRRIESLYLSGETAKNTAMIMGLPEDQVSSYVSRYGIKKGHVITQLVKDKIKEMYLSGLKVADISAAVGFSKNAVNNVIQSEGIANRSTSTIKPEWKPEIISLYKSGVPVKEIAEKFGIPRPNAISAFISKSKWLLSD